LVDELAVDPRPERARERGIGNLERAGARDLPIDLRVAELRSIQVASAGLEGATAEQRA